ncbi:MAG TPA: YqaJ viral recombinase family protein, partial [Nitrospira sp.]
MADVILPLIGPDALSPEWKEIRRFSKDRPGLPCVFGATDAAACCGMSPYKTPLDVFVQKMYGTEVEENEAMRMGKRLEPIILDEYEQRRCVTLRRNLPMFFHGKYRWIGATPDGIAVGGEQRLVDPVFGGWKYGVDAKSSTYRRYDKDDTDEMKFGQEDTDHMPVDYVMQGTQQCAVLNLPYVEFPVLFDARTMRIYRVERNEDLIGLIIHAEKEMLERLQNNDPPEPNWTHENTRELIGILFGHKEDVVKQLDAEWADQWLKVQRWKEGIKEREAWIEEVNNKILYHLAGATAGIFPSGNEQIKRIVVKESKVTQKDVDDLRE